jgi:hypothetical protein
MTFEPIGLIILAIGLFGLYRPPSFLIYAFMTSTLLGAAAASNVTAIGGISVQPAHLLFGFVVVKLLRSPEIRQRTLDAVAFGTPGFWLLLTVGVSSVMAYFMPRVFQGDTWVFAVRATQFGTVTLEPTTANITQSVYFIADMSCFLLIYGFASTRDGIKTLLHVALFVATANIAFAVLDWITYLTKTTEILSIIRNANYTMRVDDDVAGIKRTVGSFVEASSFGSVTLGYFAFTLRLWFMGVYPRLSRNLSLLALFATLLATSTSAYFGLAVLLCIIYAEFFIRAVSGPVTLPVKLFLVGGPLLLATLVLGIALNETMSAKASDLLDTFFFNKMASDSGIERSSWNQAALQSFFDTYGFGFGNGSGRASSFIIAVLANLGLIGTALFVMFFLGVFFDPSRSGLTLPEEAARKGAKSMCLAWIIGGTVSAPLIDLGLSFYAFAALACAPGYRAKTEKPELLQQVQRRLYFEPRQSNSL